MGVDHGRAHVAVAQDWSPFVVAAPIAWPNGTGKRTACTSTDLSFLGSIIAAEPEEMKINALDTYMLSVPLPQPVRTSTSTISRVSELIVRLTTDAGIVGIGEAHGPFLSQAGPEG